MCRASFSLNQQLYAPRFPASPSDLTGISTPLVTEANHAKKHAPPGYSLVWVFESDSATWALYSKSKETVVPALDPHPDGEDDEE
jgi:hypothetical protein